MADLPTGTVTFLFTDVEGSTRLLQSLGDEYADVLAAHRRALRDAFAQHGGVEVDTQGDAFFVAFASASDALAAAAAARDSLAPGPVRVRMGIHTGEPVVTDEGYVGIDVHRAARIAAAGHGGQILVSQSTRGLVGADSLRDLGRHRLKDLTAPERIYQLGEGEFPPLKTLNATNLPVASNSLVGREGELADLTTMLMDSERLVTLTGPGGSGKTRLSLQVGAELLESFPAGVFFVPLASFSAPELVRPAIARVASVRELEELGERRVLFLLDNFEHLLQAASDVAALLASGSSVKVLATSRAPLRIQGECEYAVDPLPDDDALELLVQRARSVRRDFVPDDDAAEICRRLEGLPLALELAAARLRTLDAAALLERLEHRLPLLTSGARDAPLRQQTLRATIEWSFDLLSSELQRLFAQLGVFAGTFSLEAVEVVCEASLEAVGAICEASLIKPLAGSRFLMLETIRELALEHFAELDEAEELRRRHAAYYHALTLTASLDTDREGDQHPALVLPELANIRAALRWALERGEIEFGLGFLVALEQFWTLGYTEEGMQWYKLFLDSADDVPHLLRARALRSFGSSIHFAGEFQYAEQVWQQSLAEYEQLDDEHGIAVLLHRLSISALDVHADVERARELSGRSLEIHLRLGNDKGACQPLALLGVIALQAGQRDEGVALLDESAARAGSVGWRWWKAGTLSCLADVALAECREADAEPLVRESLEIAVQLGDRVGIAWYLSQLALVLARAGECETAGRICGSVEAANAFVPGGPWPRDFQRLDLAVSQLADDAFRRGRDEGRTLSLEDVAASTLAAGGR